MTDSITTQARLSGVERTLALRKTEAFRSVPMEQLIALADVAQEQWHPAGEVLFRAGDPAGNLFVVLSGRVVLERDGRKLAEAGPEESLGTWSLFDDAPRRVTATVVEPVRLLVLEREDFFEELTEHMEITRSLVQDLVRRLTGLAGLDTESDS